MRFGESRGGLLGDAITESCPACRDPHRPTVVVFDGSVKCFCSLHRGWLQFAEAGGGCLSHTGRTVFLQCFNQGYGHFRILSGIYVRQSFCRLGPFASVRMVQYSLHPFGHLISGRLAFLWKYSCLQRTKQRQGYCHGHDDPKHGSPPAVPGSRVYSCFLLSRARLVVAGHLRYSSACIKFRNKIILRISRSPESFRRGRSIALS